LLRRGVQSASLTGRERASSKGSEFGHNTLLSISASRNDYEA